MGEEPSGGGSAVTTNAATEQIQRDIEQTREELGDTVEALAAKTDVKARATATMSQISDRVRHNPGRAAVIGVLVAGLLARRLMKR